MGDPIYTFGVSGDLYNSNLLMYDRNTKSEWLQVTGVAVEGPMRGKRLAFYPVAYDRWDHWKEHHPAGKVLSIHNGFERRFGDYETSPYAGYDNMSDLFFYVKLDDKRLPRKTRVVGVEMRGADKAYVEERLWKDGVTADRLANADIVIIADRDSSRIGVFDRAGHTFFLQHGEVHDEHDRRWAWLGDELSLGAEHRRSYDLVQTFWFAWAAMHPRTDLAK